MAGKHKIPVKEMFAHLLQRGLIEKKGDLWSLTDQGTSAGRKFVTSKKFGLSANNVNFNFSELGWPQKTLKRWRPPQQREKVGRLLAEYRKYDFKLIELTDGEVYNFDDILLRLLLKFDVQAYWKVIWPE